MMIGTVQDIVVLLFEMLLSLSILDVFTSCASNTDTK